MLSNKDITFSKRTFFLLSPLLISTLLLRSFGSDLSSLHTSYLLNNRLSHLPANHWKRIALAKAPLPYGVKDEGAILRVINPFGQDITIEQFSPLDEYSFYDDHYFVPVSLPDSSIQLVNNQSGGISFTEETVVSQTSSSSNGEIVLKKYSFTLNDFNNSVLRNKGDLKLVAKLDTGSQTNHTEVSSIISLQDLIQAESKEYQILSIDSTSSDIFLASHDFSYSSSEDKKVNFFFKLTKDPSANKLTIELLKKNKSNSTGSQEEFTLVQYPDPTDVFVKTFYFLYTDNPPLDYSSIFKSSDSQTLSVSDSSLNEKIVYLDDWKNSSGNSSSTNNPTFSFDKQESSWKSICSDPYKVGGWIDEDLKTKSSQESTAATSSHAKSQDSKLFEQQDKAWQDFKPKIDVKPKQTEQYFWKQVSGSNSDYFIYSSDYTTASLCSGIDEETKKLYKEFFGKSLTHEPSSRVINRAPSKEFVKAKSENGTSSSTQSEARYPLEKVIPSSFRAWGNGYANWKVKRDVYSKGFERALTTEHTFSLKITKDVLKQKLIEHDKLKNSDLYKIEGVTSLLKASIPMSFTVYDPVSDYLRKQRLSLHMDLNLSNIYNRNSFQKTIFSHDLSEMHGYIGDDWKGFSETNESKKTPFGISGILEFKAGLELDLQKNVLLSITAKTHGFVNTKNPSCDLRHRLFKFGQQNGQLKDEFKCSSESDWKYRKHNHIPSFLIIALEDDPQLTSFYKDRSSGTTTSRKKRSTDSSTQTITTLEKFGSDLESRQIKKIVSLDETNNGEVYFDNITAYDKNSKFSWDVEKQVTATVMLFLSTNKQYVNFYSPRKNENTIALTESEQLETLELNLKGSSSLSSYFLRTHHYNTTVTTCTTDDQSDQSTASYDCFGDKKHKNISKDKKTASLSEASGTGAESNSSSDNVTQKLKFKWDELKTKTTATSPLSLTFRTVIHHENTKTTTYDSYKTKLTKLTEDMKNTKNTDIPEFSLVVVLFSVDLWVEEKDGNKLLHYVTKVRPISLVSEMPSNSNPGAAVGASASAGFEIVSIDMTYKKS